MRATLSGLLMAICLIGSAPAIAGTWDIIGNGAAWQSRVGPGVMLAMGGNDCTDELCDDQFDTSFGGSFGGTAGFFYRFIPNLSAFADLHFGYINSDVDGAHDDRGFLFQALVGAEFHLPIVTWLDAYLGLGIGYAYLSGRAEAPLNTEAFISLKGVDFELRTGMDFYPFTAVPTLGAGLMFRMGMVHWPTACYEVDTIVGNTSDCDSPEDVGIDEDDLPFLIHFGMTVKYGF